MIKLYKADINSISEEEYRSAFDLFPNNIKEHILEKKNILSKKQSAAGYLLLSRGFKELFGEENITLRFTENGKPISDVCYFSISHSENIAACVISDKPIGLDVQKMHKIALKSRYPLFNKEEVLYVNSSPELANKRFFEVFTKKEALVKLKGEKLSDCNKLSSDDVKFNLFEEDGAIFCIAQMKN